MKIGLVALATLAFASSGSAVAAAESPFAQDKAILTLADLDLSTADGQQRLAIRLDQAARAVCGDQLSAVHLALESKAQQCRTAVVADVRSQIDARLASAAPVRSIRLAAR